MQRYTVSFKDTGRSAVVDEGTTVLAAAAAAGIEIYSPCGGKGSCGKCLVNIAGEETRACRFHVHSDIEVSVPEHRDVFLTDSQRSVFETDKSSRLAAAFDIGTTSIAGYLMDGQTGATLATASALNPQSSHGADLITRIQYALDGHLDELSSSVWNCMSDLILRMASDSSKDTSEIDTVAIAGNTAMIHLLLRKDPKPLTVPPYMPLSVKEERSPISGRLPSSEEAELRILPSIAGFVGADTSGCLLSAGFDSIIKPTLLIDIGTNGEMALSDGKRCVVCSAAAGPAFEGARITCGMRGAQGAISHVRSSPDGFEFEVIGGGPAKGLCGSGLLDTAAVMLREELIDPSGRMQIDGSPCWFRKDDVDACKLTGDVFITQTDIRQLQLAKGAVRAGIELLCTHMGLVPEDIGTVLLAGAFGTYLDPSSACEIGLIPPCLESRIISVGNAAGDGARMCALDLREFERCAGIAASAEFLELASSSGFQETFVESMLF